MFTDLNLFSKLRIAGVPTTEDISFFATVERGSLLRRERPQPTLHCFPMIINRTLLQRFSDPRASRMIHVRRDLVFHHSRKSSAGNYALGHKHY